MAKKQTEPRPKTPLMTIAEYASARRCSQKTIRRRIAEGKLPVIRTGKRVHIHEKYLFIEL